MQVTKKHPEGETNFFNLHSWSINFNIWLFVGGIDILMWHPPCVHTFNMGYNSGAIFIH